MTQDMYPGYYNVISHNRSHKECGKIVHRPCSSCISSVQEINKDSIEFFLLTQTWSGFKLEPYNEVIVSLLS